MRLAKQDRSSLALWAADCAERADWRYRRLPELI